MVKCGFLLGVLFFWQIGFAQNDTIGFKKQTKPFVEQALIPATLILTGSVLTGTFTEKTIQKNVRNKVGNDYHNSIDDYMQYVPFVQVYIGDLAGLKAKNHWFDQTKNMAIGGLATMIVVHSFKRGIGKTRPDNSSNHAFPSGHTAATFLGATILYHEYKGSSSLMAGSGYLFAASTGTFRVLNNRHWISDVLAGAGVGILVANVIYHVEPLKNWNPFKKNNNVSFCPIYNGDELTFTATLRF